MDKYKRKEYNDLKSLNLFLRNMYVCGHQQDPKISILGTNDPNLVRAN